MKPRKTKKTTTITLLLIFILSFMLGIIRWANIFNDHIFVITEEINSHITNFTISLMLCTLVGYLILYYGGKYLHTVIFGIIVIAANLIYETILPVLNTIDFIDAIYGIAAVLFSLLYLYLVDKNGFET